MLKKTINCIMYLPGWGGTFTNFVLSLDNSTFPWLPNSVDVNSEYNRKELFSFKNIRTEYNNKVYKSAWQNFHRSFKLTSDNVLEFLAQDRFTTLTISVHPIEFYQYYENNPDNPLKHESVTVNYYALTLDPSLEYIITEFKKENESFPLLRPNEDLMYKKYIDDFALQLFSFDSYIQGESAFTAEYLRMCSTMNIPVHLDDALELYRDWYVERRFDQYKR